MNLSDEEKACLYTKLTQKSPEQQKKRDKKNLIKHFQRLDKVDNLEPLIEKK